MPENRSLSDSSPGPEAGERRAKEVELTSDQLARIFADIKAGGHRRAAWDALNDEDRYTLYSLLVDESSPTAAPCGAAERELPIPRRLHEAIQCVIRETRGFSERKQEWSCRVCRYKDPIGQKLHDPNCSIYELHGAWEEALHADAARPRSAPVEQQGE